MTPVFHIFAVFDTRTFDYGACLKKQAKTLTDGAA